MNKFTSLGFTSLASRALRRSWLLGWTWRLGLLALTIAVVLPARAALQDIDDEGLAQVSGSGIALVFKDVSVIASPTSYMEFTGTAPSGSPGYYRADLRWYGLGISGTTPSGAWAGSCSTGLIALGCPLGNTIPYLAAHDNPMIMRAFINKGIDFAGTTGVSKTELEILWPSIPGGPGLAAPSYGMGPMANWAPAVRGHSPYRFAWWGELKVDNDTGANGGHLQVSNVYNNIDQSGSKLKLFQHADPNDLTMGMLYENHFAADIRMSTAQTIASPDATGVVPEFESQEGLHMEDFRVYFPLGQPHYQSMTLDNVTTTGNNGNFQMVLNPIPFNTTVYNDFYGRSYGTGAGQDSTYGYDRSVSSASMAYQRTHAYLRIGDWAPGGCMLDKVGSCNTGTHTITRPAAAGGATVTAYGNGQFDVGDKSTSDSSGMFFSAAAGNTFPVPDYPNLYSGGDKAGWADVQNANAYNNPVCGQDACTNRSAINLGDSRIEGILVQRMYLKTLGI